LKLMENFIVMYKLHSEISFLILKKQLMILFFLAWAHINGNPNSTIAWGISIFKRLLGITEEESNLCELAERNSFIDESVMESIGNVELDIATENSFYHGNEHDLFNNQPPVMGRILYDVYRSPNYNLTPATQTGARIPYESPLRGHYPG